MISVKDCYANASLLRFISNLILFYGCILFDLSKRKEHLVRPSRIRFDSNVETILATSGDTCIFRNALITKSSSRNQISLKVVYLYQSHSLFRPYYVASPLFVGMFVRRALSFSSSTTPIPEPLNTSQDMRQVFELLCLYKITGIKVKRSEMRSTICKRYSKVPTLC